ncbi:hypothetical protein [Patulibacter sp.]|uniref:hypothetical protein n=1 Tax=Patulibacter sp. TaxID=1912859 RepID=UPI0027219A40|nr:hypothetical protein [Patulibacter sp.]MDO9409515.1 hypothetical protein [Patulibacter sp.]
MRLRRSVPVVLSCTAVALTGCGGSSLLDGSTASDLQASLGKVQTAIDDGRCDEARSAATAGAKRVDELPSSVDGDLKDRLKTGFQELSDRVGTDCEESTTTTTAPETTTTAPTTTEPVEPTTPTQPETPTTTPEDPGTTTPIDPPATDPTTPADPGDGGDDGSGGVVPGVDGPGASERSRGQGPKADKPLKERLKDLRERAKKYFEGRGGG